MGKEIKFNYKEDKSFHVRKRTLKPGEVTYKEEFEVVTVENGFITQIEPYSDVTPYLENNKGDEYMERTIKISTGNSKMGKVASVSLPPITTCGNCKECAKRCYAKQQYLQYPNVKSTYDNNLELLKNNPNLYFKQIDGYIKYKNVKLFRWHVSGDIIDFKYLLKIMSIADENRDCKFIVFTKMYDLANRLLERLIPNNLKIIFSAWPNVKMNNPYKFPVAYLKDQAGKAKIPKEAKECKGNCEKCLMCFNLANGQSVYFHEHGPHIRKHK